MGNPTSWCGAFCEDFQILSLYTCLSAEEISQMHKPRNPTIHRITLLIRDSSESNFVFCLKLSTNPGRSMVTSGRWEIIRLSMVIYFSLNVPILVWQTRTQDRTIGIKYTHLYSSGFSSGICFKERSIPGATRLISLVMVKTTFTSFSIFRIIHNGNSFII